MPYIYHVSTLLPPHYYSQDELIEEFKSLWAQQFYNYARIEDVHRHALVGGRYLALAKGEYHKLQGFQQKNDRWIQEALPLVSQCLQQLFTSTGLSAQDVQLLCSNTITGLSVPSLEARVMNRLPFLSNTKRLPIFGLGCLAGAAGLNRVADYLVGHPQEAAIFFSVELCSLTLQPQDFSVANVVSTGLFGDGVAAVLMVGDKHPLAQRSPLRWLSGESQFFPNTERVMGWDFVDTGFKIVLSKDVPEITRQFVPTLVQKFLTQQHLTAQDIAFYMAHPGGPKVLQAMEEVLELGQGELTLSWEGLAKYGNMSSVSVLFVLKETLQNLQTTHSSPSAAPGALGLMLAMGPAFCAEIGLYQCQNH